jgi:prepilin-type N-terminal cleavage/methylation domain-containing protein
MKKADLTNVKNRQQGFTLIEVMVAVAVLAIGLLAVAGMQVVAIQSNTGNRDVTEASTLALDKLEFLKLLPLDDDRLDAGEHADPANPIGGKYTITWNVTDNEDTKSVSVLVDWSSGRKQKAKQVELPTVILDR